MDNNDSASLQSSIYAVRERLQQMQVDHVRLCKRLRRTQLVAVLALVFALSIGATFLISWPSESRVAQSADELRIEGDYGATVIRAGRIVLLDPGQSSDENGVELTPSKITFRQGHAHKIAQLGAEGLRCQGPQGRGSPAYSAVSAGEISTWHTYHWGFMAGQHETKIRPGGLCVEYGVGSEEKDWVHVGVLNGLSSSSDEK